MARSKASDRIPTRHRGITYRVHRDGTTRTYAVYWRGRYVRVEGGEAEARLKQAELRAADARGERVVSLRPAARVTFAALSEEWMAGKRLRPYTKRAYQDALDRILIPEFGTREVAGITRADVRSLVRQLEDRGLASSTVTSYLLPLSGTMEEAVAQGLISANPVKQLTRDDRGERKERVQDHVWNAAEISRLIAASEALAAKPEARADYSSVIRTALCTGLRLGELLGLQWADVDLAGGVLHVRRQWTRLNEYAAPKTRAAVREVPLAEDLVTYLREYRLRSRWSQDGDPVFAGRDGRPFGHRNVTGRGFEPAAKAAGLNGVSFHSCRHAFASRLIAGGVTPHVLARVMGHETAVVTERYIALYDRQGTHDALRAAMAL